MIAPLHDLNFVSRLRDHVQDQDNLGTRERISGMLAMVSEELPDVPFYYVQDRLCTLVKVRVSKMSVFRSAILNAGYRVSLSHCHKGAIKTDAPMDFIWDMMRAYEKENPSRKENWTDICKSILGRQETFSNANIDFTEHEGAEPPSRKTKMLRFQVNPPNWGPKSKARVITNTSEEVMDKRAKNQGKYI